MTQGTGGPTEYGLGRVHAPDDRDRNFRLAEHLGLEGETLTGVKGWWEGGAWYNQGNTGTCVGHGWAHEIEDAPVTHPNEVVDPFAIYDLATTLDEWSDNDGDRSAGTSVRAGAKAAQQMGYIGSYLWAWNVQDIINAILTVGPVVVGTVWYESMFEPVNEGDRVVLKVDPNSGVAGGHCYVLNRVNTETGFFRMKNSWGQGWANNGHASIRIDDFAMLLADDGEACMPTDAPVTA
jgi:hypothetical protein